MVDAARRSENARGLARRMRAEAPEIVDAWKRRLEALSDAFATLSLDGDQMVEWLAVTLEDAEAAPAPLHEGAQAARMVAELGVLREALSVRLQDAEPSALQDLDRVIDRTIDAIVRSESSAVPERARASHSTRAGQFGCWEIHLHAGTGSADPEARSLLGLAPDEESLALSQLLNCIHVDERDGVRAGIEHTIHSGSPYLGECRRDDDPSRWISMTTRLDESAQPSPRVLGTVHEITQRKRAEEEHARVVQELSRAVHVSEMFVGILSHDLRNPLGAILSGARLLELDLRNEKDARVIARIISSGERMGRMIDQLLDFTRARLGEGIAVEVERVDIADLAREVVDECKAAKPDAMLRFSALGNTVGKWDRDRLAQVISNLVGNAIQHGRSSEPVHVKVDGTDPERLELSVQNGGAIPPDLLPLIFNPFRGALQKRDRAKGLGLGLYVARQIALAHGGDLIVASNSQDGTDFRLLLPRAITRPLQSRQDSQREDETAAFERLAARPSATAVTAELFGATPLHERVPLEYWDIVECYGKYLEIAVHRQAYRDESGRLTNELRELASRLGAVGAGAREVTEVHARALRRASRGATAARTQALVVEGRLLALELMGNLVAYYRRRARGSSHAATR